MRFVCGPLRGPCRFGSALRLRAARPRLWFVRASRRRPRCPRACGVKMEAEASRGSWSVVSSACPCCGLLRRPQLVRAVFLCQRPVRFVAGRCHGPCFSPLAKPRLGFATPGSFGESRARQSAVQPGWGVGMRERNQLREEWRDRGGVNRLGSGAGSVSPRRRSRNGLRHSQPPIPVETGHGFRLGPSQGLRRRRPVGRAGR